MAQIKVKVGDLVRFYRPDSAVYPSRNPQVIGVVTGLGNDICKSFGWVWVEIEGSSYLSRLNCLAHVKFDKWMPWNGGDCPIPKGIYYRVRFRDGWESQTLTYAYLRWNHIQNHGDIVAYQIRKDYE